MQFQVPQFIETEDKIVGPLTLKQFVYVAAAAAISFMLFFVLSMWLWIIVVAILAAVAIALSFGQYDGRPLPQVLIAALNFYWQPKLYVWKREEKIAGMPAGMSSYAVQSRYLQMDSVKKLWQNLMTSKNPIPKREKIPVSPHATQISQERFESFRKLSGEKAVARRVDYR